MKKQSLWIALVSVILMLPFTGMGIWSVLIKDVTIIEEPQRKEVKTFKATVGALLRAQNIDLRELDQVEPSVGTKLEEGMTIVIKRYLPLKVKVNGYEKLVYGKNLSTREVIVKAGVTLKPNDKVNIPLDRIVKPGEVVEVIQVDNQTHSEIKSIPFKTIVKSTTHLLPGERRLAQRGTVGKVRTVYDVLYEGGKLVKKTFVKTELLAKPEAQVILKGKAPVMLMASRGGHSKAPKSFSYTHAYMMVATGYDLSFQSTGKTPGMRGFGITASGTRARVGTVAVDPKLIPLGTKLYIENADGSGGYGYAVAEDTGGAIKGYRIDLFFNSTQEALQFGRRQVRVYLLN